MSHKAARPGALEKVQELAKPMLRGYSHAVMAPVAVVVTAYLAWVTAGDLGKQVPVLVYGCTLVLLFSVSATYHIGQWSTRAREVLRRFDHSNIFLVIAGTYTPICMILLTGTWRVVILAAVWGLALTGIGISVSGVTMRRGVLTGLYILVGWLAIAAVPQILGAVGAAGGLILLAAGLLYSVGALCYALKWPPLWRRVFSYHEVFHLFVIGASVLFVVFMLAYVVPVARS
jgi:hemolysin III